MVGSFSSPNIGTMLSSRRCSSTRSHLVRPPFYLRQAGQVLQVGVVNFAREINGAQIGLVNHTLELHGFQIGLVNLSRKGGLSFMPFLNAGF